MTISEYVSIRRDTLELCRIGLAALNDLLKAQPEYSPGIIKAHEDAIAEIVEALYADGKSTC